MPGQLVATLAALLATPAMADDLAAGLLACREASEDARRLACYDALTARRPLATFGGVGGATTDWFEISGPSLLRFESLDVVLVLYLLGADGEVVQNLHHGGTGEGTFLIEKPGTYRVQVNASGGWKISVEAP